MIITALLLMQTAYSPETEAVMDRSRRQAAERRVEENRVKAQGPSNAAVDNADGGLARAMKLSPADAAEMQKCLDTAMQNPTDGISYAQSWALKGGGLPAAECVGFAEAQAENWDGAVQAFDAAAKGAQKSGVMIDAARLWVQAGNAALAGGQPEKARGYFDTALNSGLPDGLAKGEVYLDRARTLVMLNDLPAARQDIDIALVQAKDDPLAWLLSATLARRQGDLARARHDIEEARKRAPDDASVALEDGNIAILAADEAVARDAWTRVITLSPNSDPAKFAEDALSQLDAQDKTAEGNSGPVTVPSSPAR